MAEHKNIADIIEAATNNEPLSDEESLVLAIGEIIIRPEPEVTALNA